ncbi:MAG: histone deacetylase 11 [Verrucomicrobiales bacterium]|jgi:histone deacetylase 11
MGKLRNILCLRACWSSAALFMFLSVGAMLCGCSTPATLKQVLLPRSGHAVYGKVAVVYAKDYRIQAGGVERLHAFDMRKYERVYRALVDRNMFAPTDVFVPDEISRKQLLRVHTADYLDRLNDPATVARCLEAPEAASLSSEMLETRVLRPFRLASGGTLVAAREALKAGIGINIGGGYHHAMPGRGEGFCIYADIPVAIRQLQKDGKIRRALIIDLDVHQGNGTVACLQSDPDTFTFSMHEAGIYPIPKVTGDYDVALLPGVDDADYLSLLAHHLPQVFEQFEQPDIVFFVAGSDTLRGDLLAHLAMSHDGIVQRDRMVINACRDRGLPVVMTLGGGYSRDAWKAHYLSIRQIIASQRE